MPYRGLGHDDDRPPGPPRVEAPVHFLVEQEVLVVEQADGVDRRAAQQQAGAVAPVHHRLFGGRRGRGLWPKHGGDRAVDALRLPDLAEQRREPVAARLQGAVGIEDARADRASTRPAVECRRQPGEGVRGESRVGVEQQDPVGHGAAQGDVVGAGEAQIGLERDQRDRREIGLDHRRAAVARRVVDHEHLARRQRGGVNRAEAIAQQFSGVVADDDDCGVSPHSRRGGAAASARPCR